MLYAGVRFVYYAVEPCLSHVQTQLDGIHMHNARTLDRSLHNGSAHLRRAQNASLGNRIRCMRMG